MRGLILHSFEQTLADETTVLGIPRKLAAPEDLPSLFPKEKPTFFVVKYTHMFEGQRQAPLGRFMCAADVSPVSRYVLSVCE